MNWKENIIPKSFFNRDPVEVAQDLLGMYLVRKLGSEFLVGKIVETEAYLAEGDKAAHNFKGKTARNASLYLDAGHTYVHSMRQYCLLDIVTEAPEVPSSVLVRAIEPVEGIGKMTELRGEDRLENLANGPGKVCKALDITRDIDGIDVTDPNNELFLAFNKSFEKKDIKTSDRIGISAEKNMSLRFTV